MLRRNGMLLCVEHCSCVAGWRGLPRLACACALGSIDMCTQSRCGESNRLHILSMMCACRAFRASLRQGEVLAVQAQAAWCSILPTGRVALQSIRGRGPVASKQFVAVAQVQRPACLVGVAACLAGRRRCTAPQRISQVFRLKASRLLLKYPKTQTPSGLCRRTWVQLMLLGRGSRCVVRGGGRC